MIKGTGVDIIEIDRIRKAAAASEKFLPRVFTGGEAAYCLKGKQQWASLAARFAAKEAVTKALGTGIGKIRWTEIEVVSTTDGQPKIILHGSAATEAARLGISEMSLSLSHCKEYAVAFVVASGK